MTKKARQAYGSWKAQRERCYNKNCPKYKYSGAKGIKVKYSSREFVTWWLKELGNNDFKDPTCGRINHSKDYTFGNIRIEERVDNTKERNSRRRYARSKRVLCTDESGYVVLYYSIGAAAKFTGVSKTSIRQAIIHKRRLKKLLFVYFQE